MFRDGMRRIGGDARTSPNFLADSTSTLWNRHLVSRQSLLQGRPVVVGLRVEDGDTSFFF